MLISSTVKYSPLYFRDLTKGLKKRDNLAIDLCSPTLPQSTYSSTESKTVSLLWPQVLILFIFSSEETLSIKSSCRDGALDTHPPVGILRTFVVVPHPQSGYQHSLTEADGQYMLLALIEWNQPHVLVSTCYVVTIDHPKNRIPYYIKLAKKL